MNEAFHVRAVRLRIFVPRAVATGPAAGARAALFAQLAGQVAQPVIDEIRAVDGGSLVDVRETDYAVTKRPRAHAVPS